MWRTNGERGWVGVEGVATPGIGMGMGVWDLVAMLVVLVDHPGGHHVLPLGYRRLLWAMDPSLSWKAGLHHPCGALHFRDLWVGAGTRPPPKKGIP